MAALIDVFALSLNNTNSPEKTKCVMSNNKTFPHRPLNCIQINLRHGFAASASLSQIILDLEIDIVFIQEPHCNKESEKLSNVPVGYKVCHLFDALHPYSAAIIFKACLNVQLSVELCSNNIAVALLKTTLGDWQLVSLYSRPSNPNMENLVESLLSNKKFSTNRSIICMDSNR